MPDLDPADVDHLPTVLFLCTHNAGRSQMALGWFTHLAGDRAVAWSGGSEPGSEINPSAVAVMAEIGIDIRQEFPKPWTDEVVRASDVVVTMGCGDACPVYPGKRYLDWQLEDPAGQGIDAVRPIRDEIERRVRGLLAELGIEQPGVVDEVIPILRVSDAAASIDWYRRLGFAVEWEHRFEPSLPAFVSIERAEGARVYLSEHLGDAPAGSLVYLRVADVAEVATEFGVEIIEQPWATEVHLVDPDGNRLRVGTPRT